MDGVGRRHRAGARCRDEFAGPGEDALAVATDGVHLFLRLDHDDAGEGLEPAVADPFDRRSGAQKQSGGVGRGVDGVHRARRREARLPQQPGELSDGVGLPVAERRVVEARPQPPPVRRHHEDPAVRRQHPPQLAHHCRPLLGALEGMDDEDAINRRILQRQFALVDKGGQVRALRRPVQDSLLCRHEGQHAVRLAAKRPQIGRGKPQAEQRLAAQIRPQLPHPAPQHAPCQMAERGIVEIPQIDGVAEHRARLVQITIRGKHLVV